MSTLTDHDLTALVEAAASGSYNSKAAHIGAPDWEHVDAASKNIIREHALPFIFHGTKALEELGYRRPRTVISIEELDALPAESIVRDANGFTWDKWWDEDGHEFSWWATTGDRVQYSPKRVILPATILHVGGES